MYAGSVAPQHETGTFPLAHCCAKVWIIDPSRLSLCKITPMYSTLTHDIEITVLPEFVPERSDADEASYWWAYTVEIANKGSMTVQLTARHWKITDGNGKLEEVKGAGVVGEQPVLRPGETFRYTSGTNMTTPTGIMTGTYRMVNEKGDVFEAEIPVFSLDSPFARRVLN
jgi:ApaG protein